MISITDGLQAMYNSNMREKTPLELERENRLLRQRIEKAIELYQTCKEEDWCTLPIDMVNILQDGSENK